MALSVTFNGTTYSIPTTGETGWSNLSTYLQALGLYSQTIGSQVTAVRTATSSPVTVTVNDYTVITDLTVAGAVAVNLPVGVSGQIFIVVDGKGDAGTNNITITGNGGQTINGSATKVINENLGAVVLQFNGTADWKVINDFVGENPVFSTIKISSLGTGVVHSSSVGLFSSSNIVNADVDAAAAIARSKLGTGTADHVVINSGAGAFSSEATLAKSRGGSGQDNSSLTFPSSGTLATLAGTEALSNKTITSSTLQDSTTSIVDNGDATKQLKFEVSGITTGTTRTLTVPDASTTVVGTDTTQTLTNKTITAPVLSTHGDFTEIATPSSPGAGKLRVYAKTDEKLYTLNSSGIETAVGTGSGSGGVNYISNPDFEDGVSSPPTGWARYANTVAGTTPDAGGTGGSPNADFTFTASSSSPLRGTYSGLITKTANNRQGTGVSYAFTIAAADKSLPLQISFEFSASSGYVAADMGVYIYDVTNTTLITPSVSDLPAGNGKYVATFGATTSTSYRLIVHTKTTSTTAYTLKVDSVSVGPSILPNAPVVTDWTQYSLTIGGTTAAPTKGTTVVDKAYWRRVGDSMQIRYEYRQSAAGTTGTGAYLFPLPTGYAADTTKITAGGTNRDSMVGSAYVSDTATGALHTRPSTVHLYNSTNLALTEFESDALAFLGSTNLALNSTVAAFYFFAEVPIANWSSSIAIGSGVVEYGYNTDVSSTASVTGSGTALGAEGIQISASWSVGTNYTRRVTFAQPIQPGDSIVVEISGDGTAAGLGTWLNAAHLYPYVQQGTNTYGIKIAPVDNFSVNVIFRAGGLNPSNATYAGNGSAWSGATDTKWRVKKVSGQQLAPISGPIYGRVDGATIPGGVIGEVLSANATTAYTTSVQNLTSVSLTPGVWRVSGITSIIADANARLITTYITATTGGSDGTIANGRLMYNAYDTNQGFGGNQVNDVIVNLSATTTYYLTGKVSTISGLSASAHRLQATRIA